MARRLHSTLIMSINPAEAALPIKFSSLPKKAGPGPSSSAMTFAETIGEAARKRTIEDPRDNVAAATAAAEILRLQMMRNALSIGSEAPFSPSTPDNDPVKMILANIMGARQKLDNTEATDQIPQALPSPQEISPPPSTLQGIISKASQHYGVDEALIKAVVKAESNFNPNAVSHAGAQGLMQLMPATARGLGVTDSFDPGQNVMAGTRFLKDMLKRYQGNLDSALAAYNWGPGNVDRKGTGALPRETREYLAKVKTLYGQYTG